MSASRSLLVALWACFFGVFASTGDLLATDPPKVDSYGDPLPPGAVLRLGTRRLQAEGSFAWSTDGKSLITLRDGTVYIWDMTDGHLRESLLVPSSGGRGSSLAVSADGRTLVCTRAGKSLAVCDLTSGKVVDGQHVEDPFGLGIQALAMAADGRTFATASGDKLEVRIWDTATCTVRRTVPVGGMPPFIRTPLVFSPDGKLLAVANQKSIILIPVEQGDPVELADLNGAGASCLLFTREGKDILSVGGTKVEIDKTPDGTPYAHNQPQLRAWRMADRRMLFELPIHTDELDRFAAALGSDDRMLVTVHADRIQVWDLGARSVVRKIEGVRIRNPERARIGIDPAQKNVAVADDDSAYVRLWNLETGKPHLTTDQHHVGRVLRVAWSPDGTLLATGDTDGGIRLWNADTGKHVRAFLSGHTGVSHLEFLPEDNRLLASGGTRIGDFRRGGGVRIYDAASGETLSKHEFSTHVRRLALSADGRRLAVVAGVGPADPFAPGAQGIQFINLTTGQVEDPLKVIVSRIQALVWSPDGKLLSYAGEDAKVRQADVATRVVNLEFDLPHLVFNPGLGALVPGGMGEAVFFRDASSLLSTGGMYEIYRWDVTTGRRLWVIKSGTKHIRAIALSPDERLFACFCSEGDALQKKLRVWSVATQRKLQTIDMGVSPGDSMAFSPDGRRLLVGFYDGTALVYDVSEAVLALADDE